MKTRKIIDFQFEQNMIIVIELMFSLLEYYEFEKKDHITPVLITLAPYV